ncbi:ABC transporter ATP-binding protein [Neptunomonas antarctica]|uniref:Phospholipid/cholesterol/gamma-HCH transport system ATP-binding protein n=1 Tax=Neptunomonas antarctica TaxID=619304 RepID=A0A1N7P548_9GAMM|nr:ATP-binding cassette domain-containing protein [Neptunomonas antarctica]SIT05704.1 phospholipid/cholesterol/gamma-HCH transport system ATP-binding protein [Neptunomonas antarctica]
MNKIVISVSDIVTRLGLNLIHDGLSMSVKRGEIYGLLGGSGSGKSTLLKEMIMLVRPESGEIRLLEHNLTSITLTEIAKLQRRWGVLFQSGALYSSLTVKENIGITLREYTCLPDTLIQEIVRVKLRMVGLSDGAADLYPSQLSGGMIKRVALARALAMDPELLFLDEPTSGLDPVGAEAFDHLILELRDILGLTIVMVTHDLDSIWTVVDRFAVLGDKKVVAEGCLADVIENPHPIVQQFFKGARGKIRSQNGK